MATKATKPRKVRPRVGWYDGVPMPMERLRRQVERVLRANLTQDEDGDWPVQVVLVDRTTHRELHYQPMPYTHDRSADASVLREAGLPALEEAGRVAEENLLKAVAEFARAREELRALRAKPQPEQG